MPGEPDYFATALPLAGYRGAACSSSRSTGGRSRSRAIRAIRPASAPPTSSRRRTSCRSTIPTAPDAARARSRSTRGRPSRPRLAPAAAPGAGDRRHGLAPGHRTRHLAPRCSVSSRSSSKAIGQARWHAYEPAEGDLSRRSCDVRRRPRLDRGRTIIVCLDADPLGPGPDQVVNAREFASRRDPGETRGVSRLYVVESSRTLTGANADHRLSRRAGGASHALARAIAAERCRRRSRQRERSLPDRPQALRRRSRRTCRPPSGTGGPSSPATRSAPRAHALRDWINGRLRRCRSTDYAGRRRAAPRRAVGPCGRPCEAGEVDRRSSCIDGNPVYDAPADLGSAGRDARCRSASTGLYANETAPACDWQAAAVACAGKLVGPALDRRHRQDRAAADPPALRHAHPRTRSWPCCSANSTPTAHDIVRPTWQGATGRRRFRGLVAADAGSDGVVARHRRRAGDRARRRRACPQLPPRRRAGTRHRCGADPARPDDLGRPLRQQCLAAGMPEADHQARPGATPSSLSPADAARLGVDDGDVVRGRLRRRGGSKARLHRRRARRRRDRPARSATAATHAGAIGDAARLQRLSAAPREIAAWSPLSGVSIAPTGASPCRPHAGAIRARRRTGEAHPLSRRPATIPSTSASGQDSGEHFNHPRRRSDGYSLGHGDRQRRLHRLQRLRRRLPGGEQRRRGRPGGGRRPRIMHWLRIDRYERDRTARHPRRLPAGALHAVREGALRAGLPGRGLGARQRGPERPGLQPLHRHPLLPVELPLQGAPLQLVRLWRRPGIREPRRRPDAGGQAIPTSPCARAASWRSAPTASSASAGRGARPRRTTAASRTARSSPPARRPARRRRSTSATAAISARDVSTLQGPIRATTPCSRNSARARARPIWRALRNASPASGGGRDMSAHGPGRCLARSDWRRRRIDDAVDRRGRSLLTGRSWRRWWIGFDRADRHDDGGLLRLGVLAVRRRHRHLGQQHHRRLGLSHRQLRLVDRHRQCRHADLVAAAAHAPALARLDQPLRRGDDADGRRRSPACSRSCIWAGRSISTGCFPYPNTMALWPQWRSALIWDFWAIVSYMLFSIIFWYTGLIPDLATLRDRAATPRQEDRLRRLGARLARFGAPLARLRDLLLHHGGARRPARRARCTPSSASISPPA